MGNNVRATTYAEALPEKSVLFAFALSAGHREPDRIVAVDLKRITVGPAGLGAVAGSDALAGPRAGGAASGGLDDSGWEALVRRVFDGTGYRVTPQPNMADWLLCHAAFVLPIAFACYHVDGDLRHYPTWAELEREAARYLG